MLYAVIMAGGSGTRFWPASTHDMPKQFLDLFGNGTMIQETVRRMAPLVPADRIVVVTNDRFVDIVKEQLPELPEDHIIGENVAKNTAPCIALAAGIIEKKSPGSTIIVLPSDHVITNEKEFIQVMSVAAEKAQAGNNLVTIGIEPNKPETGYGYIQFDEPSKVELSGKSVYEVKTFAEKPDKKTAQMFLESGDFLWNSGMFVWRCDTILKATAEYIPTISAELKAIEADLGTSKQGEAIKQFYTACPSISIDYGVMEKADTVFVVPGSFGWNDVGSWTAVHELMDKDSNGNVLQAPFAKAAQSRNSMVSSKGKKIIALVGLDNVAVVETENAILVVNLKQAQHVKEISTNLEGEYAQFK